MEHENCIGETSEWYTPPDIFNALNIEFDLDPCSPGPLHWVPAINVYTKKDNGLLQDWCGIVFMNPPFLGRNGHVPWLIKFLNHANGIAIVRAYTSAEWFHDYAIKADCLLFPKGKTKFIRPCGDIGKAPGAGIVLLGMGKRAMHAMKYSDLGWFVDNRDLTEL